MRPIRSLYHFANSQAQGPQSLVFSARTHPVASWKDPPQIEHLEAKAGVEPAFDS